MELRKVQKFVIGLLLPSFVCLALLLVAASPEDVHSTLNTEESPQLAATEYSETVRTALSFRSSAGPWFCRPDSDTELLPDAEQTRNDATAAAAAVAEHELQREQSRNQRALSRLGVPFVFDANDGDALLCFQRIVSFRDRKTGWCPAVWAIDDRYAVSFRPHYYLFHPEELEERYGASRLSAFALVDQPWQWEAVEEGSTYVGDALHAADAYIAALPEPPNLLGAVTMLTPHGWGESGSIGGMDISLADITVDVAEDGSRMPILRLDAEATSIRFYRRRRVRAKLEYAKFIDEHDEAIRHEARAVAHAIEVEVAKAQRHYITERRRRESYEQFVQQRRDRMRAETHSNSLHSIPQPWHPVTPFLLSQEGSEARRQKEKLAQCYRLTQALHTLAAQKALDRRKSAILTLMRKADCTLGSEGEDMTEAKRNYQHQQFMTLPLSESVCSLYCEAVSDLERWQAYTGQAPTVSQSFAFLLTLYANVTLNASANVDPSAFTPDGAMSMPHFASWVHQHFVQSQFDGCPCVSLPSRTRAEFYFTAALLELLLCSSSSSSNSACSHTDSGIARAILLLHQAMWLGSEQAAAALSTLREQGIYMKQNLKAAQVLLAISMKESHGTLYKELWRELQQKRTEKTKPAPRAVGKASANAAAERNTAAHHAERLLRRERMYGMAHSWTALDKPYATKELVMLVLAADDQHFEAVDEETGETVPSAPPESVLEEEEADEAGAPVQGQFGAYLQNKLSKAAFFMHGFRIKRDVHTAECLLLSILRKFEYLCDIHAFMGIAHKRSGETSKLSTRSQEASRKVIDEMKGVCSAHSEALSVLFQKPRAKRFRCPWPDTTEGGSRRGPPFPIVEDNYDTLKSTLAMLGYVYLAKGEYGRAALYARLSIQLAASVFRYASQSHNLDLSHGSRVRLKEYMTHYHLLGTSAAKRQAGKTSGLPWWTIKLVNSFIEFDEELLAMLAVHSRVGNKWLADNATFPLSLVDSTFAVNEELIILAAAVLLDESPSGELGEGGETVAMLSAKELLQTFSADVRNATVFEHLSSRSLVATCARAPLKASALHMAGNTPLGKRQRQQQTAFYLLLAAASQWRAVSKGGNVLDRTLYSFHTADPFLMLSWLLRDMESTLIAAHKLHGENNQQCVSIGAIRAIAGEIPQLLGVRPFVPFPHDTVETYARRLLAYPRKHLDAVHAFVDAFHSGMAHITSHGAGSVNGDAIRRHSIGALRIAKKHAIDRAQFTPLLHASDAQAYVTRNTGWTAVERVADALLNGLYYPFTETNAEKLLREMGLEMLSSIPGETPSKLSAETGDNTSDQRNWASSFLSFLSSLRPESPAAFVREFIELFSAHPEVRDISIAVQLLSATLNCGLAEGFSLILLEATSTGGRRNRYLRPFADYIATSVFGPLTGSMWLDEHVTAQWHRDKPATRGYSSVFTLNTHAPFRYTFPEPRQELMARVDRWRAHQLLERAAKAVPMEQRPLLLQAADILARCSGTVTHASLQRWLHLREPVVRLPRSPFEGATYPAADPECAHDLLMVLLRLGKERVLSFTTKDATVYLDRVMEPMLTRFALYYSLIKRDDPPTRMLPSTHDEFDEEEPGLGEEEDSSDELDEFDEGDERNTAAEVDVVVPDDRSVRFCVEPWAIQDDDSGHHSPKTSYANGEGAFYFSRLHRISGLRSGARIQSWWYWIKAFLSL